MPVANATRIVALAHCIVHGRALVTKVDQFDIFAAARGVTGHHDSRRRDDHQGQSGEDDADQFQSALVRHRKTSSLARPRKARPVFRLGPFASSSSATVFMKRISIATCSRCRELEPRNDLNRLLEPPSPVIRRHRGRVMLRLIRSEARRLMTPARSEKRIQKWLWVQARYRGRFCRVLTILFQQSAALVAGTAGPKVDCPCAASRYWRQGNWKWTARTSAGAL